MFVPGGERHLGILAKDLQASQFLISALGRSRVVGAAGRGRSLLSLAGIDAVAAKSEMTARLIVDDGVGTAIDLVRRFVAALPRRDVLAFEVAVPARAIGRAAARRLLL